MTGFTHITASEVDALSGKLIQEQLGFKPENFLLLRLDKTSDPQSTRASLIRRFSEILNVITGTVVLLFETESVVAFRTKTDLYLNPIEGFWTEAVLAEIKTPYEFKKFEVF